MIVRVPGCAECGRLEMDVALALEHLRQLTTAQLSEFKEHFQSGTFMNLDRELENAVGEKERRIGALRQHQREHERLPENLMS